MLILLDIDGVMVPIKSWKKPTLLEDGFMEFSSKAVKAINNLITEETTIILTTSHKSKYSVDEWKKIFEIRGIKISKIKTLNENVEIISRKDEILNWFTSNEVNEDFIIIDDDKSLHELPECLKSKWTLTDSMIGLNVENVCRSNGGIG